MGLEVGWHLRFSRADVVEARIDRTGLAQLEDTRAMHPDWDMRVQDAGDHLLVRFVPRSAPRA